MSSSMVMTNLAREVWCLRQPRTNISRFNLSRRDLATFFTSAISGLVRAMFGLVRRSKITGKGTDYSVPPAKTMRKMFCGTYSTSLCLEVRCVLPGFPHHVTQRGTDRQIVFHTQRDRRVYLDLLKEYSHQAGVSILA